MSQGIFVEAPFHFNVKCVVISILFMIIYWILPSRNPYLLPLIFIVSYVGIAWYDKLYACEDRLLTGQFGVVGVLDAWAKPQDRKKCEECE